MVTWCINQGQRIQVCQNGCFHSCKFASVSSRFSPPPYSMILWPRKTWVTHSILLQKPLVGLPNWGLWMLSYIWHTDVYRGNGMTVTTPGPYSQGRITSYRKISPCWSRKIDCVQPLLLTKGKTEIFVHRNVELGWKSNVGVVKPYIPSFSQIFRFTKTTLTYRITCSYFSGVIGA